MKDKNGKTRMAGEALEELSAKEEGFRNALERNIGTEEYDRISPSGAQDLDDSGRMTAREVIAEFRERPKGVSVDEGEDSMVAKYQKMVDEGTTFNKRAREYLEGHGVDFGGDMIDDPVTDPNPDPVEQEINTPVMAAPVMTSDNNVTFSPPGMGPGIDGFGSDQLQQIAQDNDIQSYVYGDNNSVTNTQDNSISQSAGSRHLANFLQKHNFFA